MLFIVATDVFKDIAIDIYIDGSFLVISFFILKRFEIVRTISRFLCRFFFLCKNNDLMDFSSLIKMLFILQLKILIPCILQHFLNHGIRISLFGKSRNISFNPQFVYIRHFGRRIHLKTANDISHFKL